MVDDHNAPGALGIGPVPLNMVNGRRQTPADHYLDPALGRPNLTLRAGVLVNRVRAREAGRPASSCSGPTGRSCCRPTP